MNHLYYGDNLTVLRDSVPDERVDLIYLDPLFNSNASYNVLFKGPSGHESAAQIEAFDDTWHWTNAAEDAYGQVLRSGSGAAAELLRAMRSLLGATDMMAYLAMMAIRLLELHRVLKPTGSIYLHCDPTASHYLKLLMDVVFGAQNFLNEVVWHYGKYTNAANHYQKNHDVILVYCKKRGTHRFNKQFDEGAASTRTDFERGYRRHRPKAGPQLLVYDRVKARAEIEKAAKEGRKIVYREGKTQVAVSDVWRIPIIGSTSKERLGYPTQKPVALLERIISTSSNPGDLVLDPFCGCGTTVHAAETLNRQWFGIDITHLAISLIEKRLRDAFANVAFTTHGVPRDLAGARDLARRGRTDGKYYFEFEKWALSLINAQPGNRSKRGADRGIDGVIYFGKTARAIVSVKAGANVSVAMLRDLRGVIEQEGAEVGVFLTLTDPTKPMNTEAAAAGQFQIEGFPPVPRIQIVTIEQALVLRHRAVNLPIRREDTFRKAPREEDRGAQNTLGL
ncbi:MAG: restriction endonuclease [Rhodobacteraceae bacterium]|nr:restriction endonuclease [Paracoccaceae bacterium]